MPQNTITIVITTFKSDNKIINCLKSIDPRFKVIIVENSNSSSFKKKIEEDFLNVKCILSSNNLGYAKGNNFGLSLVDTPYALILNPDTILGENCLQNFISITNKLKNFAIIAPAIQDEKNSSKNSKVLTEVNSVKGFAMFLNMKEFKDIGFFDENFFIYLEEVDLCRRLKQKNKKIYVDPSIIIKHQGGNSHDDQYDFEMELSRNWHWMWSTFYYNKKYNGYLSSIVYVSKKIISSILKYFFYLFVFNKKKKLIYKHRLSGLYNSIIGKPSWYRPFNNN